MTITPLTVSEARSILAANKILHLSHGRLPDSGSDLNIETRETWERLVESATRRVALYEGS